MTMTIKHLLMTGCIMVAAVGLGVGCTSHRYPVVDPDKAVPTRDELKKISGKRHHVPVRIIVNASDSMVGKVGGNLMYYPLRQIIESCFDNITYKVFDQPHGEVINSFELKIEPSVSILSTSWGTASYKLVLYATFYEPGEKRLNSFCLDTTKSSSFSSDQIPDVVFDAVKELAVETMYKIINSAQSQRAIARFEER